MAFILLNHSIGLLDPHGQAAHLRMCRAKGERIARSEEGKPKELESARRLLANRSDVSIGRHNGPVRLRYS